MRRGFTLIELCYVITVMALLTAVTVPAADVLMRRAHTDEARTTVFAIAHAELQHFRDSGEFVACGPSGDIPTRPGPFLDAPCWQRLQVQITDSVRYRYQVQLVEGSFVVTAEGDLDHDGIVARYTLHGRDFQLDVEAPLE